jgi:chemotaxis signal transduction protein/nucleoid-associated protein YgaU
MSLSVEQMHHEKSLLLFRVEPYRICVPSVDVKAIITVPTFRSIPRAPVAMRGVFSYRGQIAGIISLRRKFGLHDYKDATTGQLVLTRISCGLTGFWVDEVLDIVASTGDDVIVLPVLSRLTVFDHFLILDDRIAQYTTFEQIYQAPDASPRQRSPEHSVVNQKVEAGQGEKADDRTSAGTAEVIPLGTAGSAAEKADPAVCQAADEIARQPDAKKKGIGAPPGRKFDATADVVDLRSHRTKNQGASSTFRLKSRSAPTVIKRSNQSRHPSDRRQTTVATANLSDRFSRGRIAHQSVADRHIQPEVADRSTRQKHFWIFIPGILLLAGLILLTYWLWPQEKSFVPVARVLETEKVTLTADPIPTASSKDASRKLGSEIESHQDTARSVPIRDNSTVAEKVPGSVTATGDTPGDSAGELRSGAKEEQNTVRTTPNWNDNVATEKVSGSVTSTGEITGDSARELRSKTEEEQNTARSTPAWDDNADVENVTGSVISSEERPGETARKLPSDIEEDQNTARSTPVTNRVAIAAEVTGIVATTGEIPGDSARELRSEIEEEQNTAQSIPAGDNNPVAEKAYDSVTATGEKVEEVIGNKADGELMTHPASASQGPQTASVNAPIADESADQLLKIETDDFTLTIERGKPGITQQPPQEVSARTERKGDTEPSPAGATPLTTTEHIHMVVKGDTLWDIAAKYLGNPFRYPELAELSRIKNPHWIYPGDLIRIIKKKVPGKSNY